MTDDATSKLQAQILVHDKLMETLLVSWVAGMTETAGEEFLAEHRSMLDPEHSAEHDVWLDKVREEAAKLRSVRLYQRSAKPN